LPVVVVVGKTPVLEVVRVVYYTIRTNPYQDKKQLLLVPEVPEVPEVAPPSHQIMGLIPRLTPIHL